MKGLSIDTQMIKKGFVILAVLIAIPMLAVLLGSAPFASAAPPEPRELPGLREAPGIPVRSIILRRNFPDHPGRRPPQGGKGCDKNVDLTSTLSGVVAVAAQDNIICTNADLDTYIRGLNTFVVQAGGDDAVDVDPRGYRPAGHPVCRWGYGPTVKHNHRGKPDSTDI